MDKETKIDQALDTVLNKTPKDKKINSKKDVKAPNELVENVDKTLILEDGRQLLI